MSALRIGRPGHGVQLIRDDGPVLSPRQEHVLHVVRSFNGNQSRAARHLGVTVAAVQRSISRSRELGANVPPRITRKGIPNGHAIKTGPRCHKVMRSGICGRGIDHPGFCVREAAWHRKR